MHIYQKQDSFFTYTLFRVNRKKQSRDQQNSTPLNENCFQFCCGQLGQVCSPFEVTFVSNAMPHVLLYVKDICILVLWQKHLWNSL